MTDSEREIQLVWLGMAFQHAKTPDERRDIWAKIKVLHAGRSAERVRQMEQEKGLSA